MASNTSIIDLAIGRLGHKQVFLAGTRTRSILYALVRGLTTDKGHSSQNAKIILQVLEIFLKWKRLGCVKS